MTQQFATDSVAAPVGRGKLPPEYRGIKRSQQAVLAARVDVERLSLRKLEAMPPYADSARQACLAAISGGEAALMLIMRRGQRAETEIRVFEARRNSAIALRGDAALARAMFARGAR